MFGQKRWIILFGKCRSFALFKTTFFWSKNYSFFYPEHQKTIFSDFISPKKKKLKKILIFGQKKTLHYTLSKMTIFFLPFKTFVFGLKFILFYTEYQETIFSNIITSKTLLRKRLIFGQKPWTNLLGKDRFFGAQQNGTFLV